MRITYVFTIQLKSIKLWFLSIPKLINLMSGRFHVTRLLSHLIYLSFKNFFSSVQYNLLFYFFFDIAHARNPNCNNALYLKQLFRDYLQMSF